MDRPPAKSVFVLLALGLWIFASPASLAEDEDPNALRLQLNQLIGQGKYQEAIPVAERAVEVAKHSLGADHPKTADALNYLGFIFQKIGNYAKAEPPYQEALRIRQKFLGQKIPTPPRASIPWASGTRIWASPPEPSRFTRKRSGSGRGFSGQRI